jgi:hypothetical protein
VRREHTNAFGIDTEYAICVQDFTLLKTNGANGIALGYRGCPTSVDDRPAAVVNTEHPSFITLGFCMILAGFAIQYFAVPEPKTIAQLRQEIKALRMRERANWGK